MSENKLRVRDVDFNGAELRAAQEIETGKVYVGVRWVCQGMGFDHERMKNERKKIQKDIVLSEGVKFYPLGSGNSGTEVLCLDLDFIPLWLAKIAITPTMQRENPDLVNKLIDYQLHAKDVLAAAFLNKEPGTQPGPKAKGNILQVQLPEINVPDYSNEIKIMTDKMQRLIDDNILLNNKIDQLYVNMGKFSQLMLQDKVNNSVSTAIETKEKAVVKSRRSQKDECKEWKNAQYAIAEELVKTGKFKDKTAVLVHIYKKMNAVYGVVWEQESKDYRKKYNLTGKVPLIDIVYDSSTYRSIFEMTLLDLYDKYKDLCIDRTTAIIQPLIEKYGDHSIAGMKTYRIVYKRMNEMYPAINWKTVRSRYTSKYGTPSTKKELIENNSELLKKFQNAVEYLLIQ